MLGELTPGGGAGGFANYQMGGGMNGYTVENWKNASSPEDAAIAFCWVFERPGIPRMDIMNNLKMHKNHLEVMVLEQRCRIK